MHIAKPGGLLWCGWLPGVFYYLLISLFSGNGFVLAAVMVNTPEVILAGKPAPPPSSSVCGFVLLAHDLGPQVAATERPATCVIALEPQEEVTMAIRIRGVSGSVKAHATATMVEQGEAEVTLSWADRPSDRAVLNRGAAQLTTTVVTNGEVVLHLRALARTTATVRWQNVRVEHANGVIPISLYPGSGNVEQCPPRILPALRKPIEQALIEWDWRMQDGIGTERAPVQHSGAVDQILQRGETLMRELKTGGLDVRDMQAQWQELQTRRLQLALRTNVQDQQWEELWRTAHQARRKLVFANPLARTGPLAFMKQVPGMFSHQLTQYYGSCARPGGGLFILEAPGESMAVRQLAAGQFPEGSYQHLDLSHDVKRLLFAYCQAATTPKDREQHLDRFYHLYEIRTDGTGLRQLTRGDYDDFSPRYMPDGKILFCSTRRGGFHRCGRGPCPVYTLALAEADGSNPRPISYHETHEWDPAVLHDGRILYTRWDYVDRHAVYYEQLWTVRPDGSGVQAFYGNNTFNPVGIWEAQPIPGSERIMATAAAHHAMTAGSIILLDTTRGIDGPAPITRLTPDALFPESESPVLQMPRGAWSAPAGLEQPATVPIEEKRWPGHCYRTPYPLSEKFFFAAYSFDPLVGEPTWNRANMFGLYLVDSFGNKELLYRDLNIASVWPTLLRPRSKPAPAVALADDSLGQEGTIFLQDVHTSWPQLPRQKISRLRILQVVVKSTPHANTPTVGIAHASPGKLVLGTVPVEADGSAFFRAPSGLPLAFQALDERGQAVQTMRSVTYLQPGERASCIGCHEQRHTAPAQHRPALALQRQPSVITPAPEGSNPLSYPILVQPVLDRKCVSCHNPAKPEGKVVLTGETQGRYTTSYLALAPRVPYSDWAGRPGDFRVVNREPVSPPDFFGARGCKLMRDILAGTHYEVSLNSEEIDRLATWMDANALFYGTFNVEDQAKQLAGQKIAGPDIK